MSDLSNIINSTLEEFKQNINQVKNVIDTSSDEEKCKMIDQMTEEQIKALRQSYNVYNKTINSNKEGLTCLSVTNLKEEYLKRLLMTSMTGYVYRYLDEYSIEEKYLKNAPKKSDFMINVDHPDKKNKEFVNNKFNELYINLLNKHNIEKKLNNTINKEIIKEIKNKIEELSEFKVEYEIEFNKFQDELNSIKNKEKREEREKIIKRDITPFILDKFQSIEKEHLIKYLENNVDPNILIEFRTEANKQLEEFLKPSQTLDVVKFNDSVEKSIKKQSLEEQVIIKRFLDSIFEYNPDLHIKSSYEPNKKDPEREDISTVLKNYHIPPKDTFARFNRYYSINYDELRDITNKIYTYKPDLDLAINVFKSFNDSDEAKAYINKYRDEIMTEIFTIQNNHWTLLGPFKKNRERLEFYGQNQEVIKNILEQKEKDNKIEAELLKDRVKKMRIKNSKQYGSQDEFIEQYKKDFSSTNQYGNEGDDYIEVDESGNLVDEDGVPKDAVAMRTVTISKDKSRNDDIYIKEKKISSD